MNENENEKKPEEGEAAAPATPETGAEGTDKPETSEPAAASGEEAAKAAEPQAWTTQPFDQPDPGAGSEAGPGDAPAAAAPAPPEPADEPPVSDPPEPAEPLPWATQPFDQPDPGAGPESSAEPAAEQQSEAPETVSEQAAEETESSATPVADSFAEVPDLASEAEPVKEVPADPVGEEEAIVATEPEPEAAEEEPKPLSVYEYRFVRVKQNAWDTVEPAILGDGAAAVTAAGGQLYGVWLGQIGLSVNQGVVVTVWPDLDSAKRNGQAAIAGMDDIQASETLYMEPTARPVDPTPPEGPGMFAHRIFEVRKDDTERFVELSAEAWPQFEEVFGTRIFALWRETGHDRAVDRLILLTRYADYAAWEKSRFWRPEPDPNAADALAKFKERREITIDTVVYTTRLASPVSS